jgi:tripartite-type tricarboxylate transporter receptor subunit TctC
MKFIKVLVLLACALPLLVHAQGRTVRVIVPYAPGGNIDGLARVYSKFMGDSLKENWIVENIAGGSGVVGTERVARAAPDGTTLLFSADVHSMAPLVIKNLPYDPIKDFQPVALLAKAPLLFVVNAEKVQAKNFTELVAEIKRDPKRHSFAISGSGSSPQLGAEMFKTATGLDILSAPYRGTGPAVNDLVGGHVTMMTVTPLAALQLVKSGKLRAIAVTSAQRFDGAPEVPTSEEAGLPGYEITNSYGFWAPRGLPPAVLDKLSSELRGVASDPALKKRLFDLGVVAFWNTPADFEKHIRAEFARNKTIYERAGVKPE